MKLKLQDFDRKIDELSGYKTKTFNQIFYMITSTLDNLNNK